MRRAISALAGAALLVVLGATGAHAKGEYSRSGLSAAFLGTFTFPTWEDELNRRIFDAAPGTPPASISPSGGFEMRGGYRFHERVAAETGFEWIAAYSITQNGAKAAEASNWMYYVTAKVYMLTDTIQPFVGLGMGAYHLSYDLPGTGTRVDDTSFAPRFSGGVDYYIDWRWGLTAEVNFVIGTRELVRNNRVGVSVGAFYRF